MRALGPWLYEGLVGPLHGGRHLTDTECHEETSGAVSKPNLVIV
jgi:hypothetical protein